jgi:hypothetical protein
MSVTRYAFEVVVPGSPFASFGQRTAKSIESGEKMDRLRIVLVLRPRDGHSPSGLIKHSKLNKYRKPLAVLFYL